MLLAESPYGDVSTIAASIPPQVLDAWLGSGLYLEPGVKHGAGNIGKQLKRVCYNEWQSMSAAWLAQPFPASANHIRLGTLNPQ